MQIQMIAREGEGVGDIILNGAMVVGEIGRSNKSTKREKGSRATVAAKMPNTLVILRAGSCRYRDVRRVGVYHG